MKNHPSLDRIYKCLQEPNPNSDSRRTFFYFDESYTAPNEGLGNPFYAFTGVKLDGMFLQDIREDLKNIIGGDRWHTTDQIQTSEGMKTFEELIKYFSQHRDPSFITCNIFLDSSTDLEDARRECIKKMIENFVALDAELEGLIFEARNVQRDNDRDKSFLKSLREQGVLPMHLARKQAWVTPTHEPLLFAPDIVAMAYRRTLTHNDITANFFPDYLEQSTKVISF